MRRRRGERCCEHWWGCGLSGGRGGSDGGGVRVEGRGDLGLELVWGAGGAERGEVGLGEE